MYVKIFWWVIPTIFTIFAFAVAWAKCKEPIATSYFADCWTPLANLAKFVCALVASLIAWLVYFIIF